MPIKKNYLTLILLIFPCLLMAQEIELFQQFNGRYDYLSFGNTLNITENLGSSECEILTESSADFALEADQTIVAAYLYWAGSGEGDFEVAFNGTPLQSERFFTYTLPNSTNVYFAAFVDITALLTAGGNDTYTLSELDLNNDIQSFCGINGGNATNFGGWAVTVVFEDPDLNLNQVNIFDGYDSVSGANPELNIELENLNVVDNLGAKIGFLAWEGDAFINNNETLSVNGNVLSNDPLNPADNAFNGTNSFTGSDQLFNMDIDVYDIENNINPGDISANIRLTSSQDLVIINNIVTVLNTELPDGTIEIDSATGGTECGNREIDVDYTVFNVNSTGPLPANTPIAFYANNTPVGQAETTVELPIDGSESGSITLTIPGNFSDFLLRAVIDDDGTGVGIVNESNEDNNEFSQDFTLLTFPNLPALQDQEQCNVLGIEVFDLTESVGQVGPDDILSFHTSEDDANDNLNPIAILEDFVNTENPQTIWIRIDNGDCFVTASFEIEVIECPLPDATISIDNELSACRQRDFTIEYTVYNLLGTGPLPGGTPIVFYIDGNIIGQTQTLMEIPIGGSEAGSLDVSLSDDIPDLFTVLAVVDDDGTGVGIVEELNESNNTFEAMGEFLSIPPIAPLPDLLLCDEGLDMAFFDLTVQNELISTDPGDSITFYTTMDDALENTNPIFDPEQYQNTTDPQIIYVRLENEICFTIGSFLLTTENCPPDIPDGMSPNGDTLNDPFKIDGLIDIFTDFNLKIYSREGNLIFEGGNEDGLWDGIPNTGILVQNKVVPVGTYYYVLVLNDEDFPEPIIGWLYVNY